MFFIEFEYVPRCSSVVVETIPGVLRTLSKIVVASESDDIPTSAPLTASALAESMKEGLYITGWLGAWPKAGSGTYWLMSKHQSSFSEESELSQYEAMVLSLAKATSPTPSDRHFTAPP